MPLHPMLDSELSSFTGVSRCAAVLDIAVLEARD